MLGVDICIPLTARCVGSMWASVRVRNMMRGAKIADAVSAMFWAMLFHKVLIVYVWDLRVPDRKIYYILRAPHSNSALPVICAQRLSVDRYIHLEMG